MPKTSSLHFCLILLPYVITYYGFLKIQRLILPTNILFSNWRDNNNIRVNIVKKLLNITIKVHFQFKVNSEEMYFRVFNDFQ